MYTRGKNGPALVEMGGEGGGEVDSALEISELVYNSVVVSTGLCSPRYVNPRWE